MTCTTCGAANVAGALFCARCGHALKPDAVTGPTRRLGSEQLYPGANYTTNTAWPQQSGGAIVALVLAILSFFGLFVFASIPALMIGYAARSEIRASRGQLSGAGVAQAGIVLGWINLGLCMFTICALCVPFWILFSI